MNNGAAKRMNGISPRPRGNGVLYAATCSPLYVEMAFLSAETMRQRHPHLPIVLFTEQTQHPLCGLGLFSAVLPIKTEPKVKSAWSKGQLARIYALLLSPFERTVHIDADTRVIGDITPAFTVLDKCDIAMVECRPERSISRRYYGGPMYNAGFCAYRLAPNVKKLLLQWAANSRINFIHANTEEAKQLPSYERLSKLDEKLKHQFLGYDQTSLVELFAPDVNVFKVRGATLPYAYNFTFSDHPECLQQLPRIVSHPSFKQTTLPDLLALAARWRAQGRGVQAKIITDYVAARWTFVPPPQLARKGEG
jgi:hypothetical protein